MQIVCPNCETAYDVDATALGASGRSVRCARCRTTWFAANTAVLAEIAAAHRSDIAQIGAPERDAGGLADWPPDVPRLGEEPGQEGDASAFVHDAPSIAADAEPASPGSEGGTEVIDSVAVAPTDPADAPKAPEDIESVAARRAIEQARRSRFGLRFPGWPMTVLMLLLIDLALVAWRADIVRMAPQTASLYAALGMQVNLRGLAFTDVRTQAQAQEGVSVLLVQGRIVSTAKRSVEVPRLRFAALNESGSEIYTWTALPGRSLLGPGESLDFQSRLASPPPETREVLVRFFNRRDLASPIQ
jgi:predicted Zn finger-like uncharacterized protein